MIPVAFSQSNDLAGRFDITGSPIPFPDLILNGSSKMAHHTDPFREEACALNRALPAVGLVTMHSGNASVYDPESGRVFIKPSGMDYEKLTPANIVEVNVHTGVVSGDLRPSVDLPHHLFLYRHLEGIRSVIHTHSNYATAFAACLKPIPLCLTAIADEFGGEIPCAPYVGNEGDLIGRTILKYRSPFAPAILMGNHGVFAWGKDGRSALKAAVMVEDVAKTAWLASQVGQLALLPEEEARKWNDRYQNRYGQSAAQAHKAA
jgi:L-ribulose-5-phosphate 4-epimerase